MSQGLLVLNAGSSSIKFSVFALPADGGELELVCRGLQENISEARPRFTAFDRAGRALSDTPALGQYRKLGPDYRRRSSDVQSTATKTPGAGVDLRSTDHQAAVARSLGLAWTPGLPT
ncbi:MAG: hypothetical protein U5O69_08430 [Candidatus Competibacteraceae bacterium]|nr:hypothetical protein [Candidatus Competibacteraceae bacterium]